MYSLFLLIPISPPKHVHVVHAWKLLELATGVRTIRNEQKCEMPIFILFLLFKFIAEYIFLYS